MGRCTVAARPRQRLALAPPRWPIGCGTARCDVVSRLCPGACGHRAARAPARTYGHGAEGEVFGVPAHPRLPHGACSTWIPPPQRTVLRPCAGEPLDRRPTAAGGDGHSRRRRLIGPGLTRPAQRTGGRLREHCPARVPRGTSTPRRGRRREFRPRVVMRCTHMRGAVSSCLGRRHGPWCTWQGLCARVPFHVERGDSARVTFHVERQTRRAPRSTKRRRHA